MLSFVNCLKTQSETSLDVLETLYINKQFIHHNSDAISSDDIMMSDMDSDTDDLFRNCTFYRKSSSLCVKLELDEPRDPLTKISSNDNAVEVDACFFKGDGDVLSPDFDLLQLHPEKYEPTLAMEIQELSPREYSDCGEVYFGRADIFRPILTWDERQMVGLPPIPTSWLENNADADQLMQQDDGTFEDEPISKLQEESVDEIVTNIPNDKISLEDNLNFKKDAESITATPVPTSYFIDFETHGVDVDSNHRKHAISLKKQRNQLLQTMKIQEIIDLESGRDKETTKRLIACRMSQVKAEYGRLLRSKSKSTNK